MRIFLEIEDGLLEDAMACTGLPTKEAAVEGGLRLLLQVQTQGDIRKLRGKVRWEDDLDESRQDIPSD